MKKISAKTLHEALILASAELGCSVLEIEYEIVQNASKGFFGFGARDVIIVADKKGDNEDSIKPLDSVKGYDKAPDESLVKPSEQDVELALNSTYLESAKILEPKPQESLENISNLEHPNNIIGFFDASPARARPNSYKREYVSDIELLDSIRLDLHELFSYLPFNLTKIDVSLSHENEVYIEIEGEDCALLIGEKGYRYNALFYILFNWLNIKYGLFLRLEIAEFLKHQEQIVDAYLQEITYIIDQYSRAKTKPLDGILGHIALQKLRQLYPNKYISFRFSENGEQYIIINDFR